MAEEYLSVTRMSFVSWKEDILNIPQRKNRLLYGYAEMNVGEIRNIRKDNVKYDVVPCDNKTAPSHAGIFITVNNEKLIIQGGKENDQNRKRRAIQLGGGPRRAVAAIGDR